jgi:hypothetical protein
MHSAPDVRGIGLLSLRLFPMVVFAVLLLAPARLPAAGVITNCTEAVFRAALVGGGTVLFETPCSLQLTQTVQIDVDIHIDAGSHSVVLTAAGTNRLFLIKAGQQLTLTGLTLNGGRSTNGGAIYIETEASVLLTNCTLAGNQATGRSGIAGEDGEDRDNVGQSGGHGTAGEEGFGGAIYNLGDLSVFTSRFLTNSASGGAGGDGGDGGGGYWEGGEGGAGAAGAGAWGGAIYNAGSLLLSNTFFSGNTVTGGNGGAGGAGGSAPFRGLPGSGGIGGLSGGAALYNAQTTTVVNCTFADNVARGGNGEAGGSSGNNGKAGRRGGDSFGGGIDNDGTLRITNATFLANRAIGGNGGNGGPGSWTGGNGGNGGDAYGGNLLNAGTTELASCTFANGSATGGTRGSGGPGAFTSSPGKTGLSRGGNIANVGDTLAAINSIFANALSGANAFGGITDRGHNISSDSSAGFSHGESMNNTNPRLGTFGDHGGPTPTILLLSTSPAIDAANDAACLPFDQRGLPRPAGDGCDIGAIEVTTLAIIEQPQSQAVASNAPASFNVTAIGEAPLRYRWRFNGANIAGATNSAFTLANVTGTNVGNYDVVVTNLTGAITSAVATLTIVSSVAIAPETIHQTPNGQFEFAFPTQTGLAYVVEYKDALDDPIWIPLSTNNGTGGFLTNAAAVSNQSSRFYRIAIQ